nr:hypothetical protein [Luteibacter rhizovicinus]
MLRTLAFGLVLCTPLVATAQVRVDTLTFPVGTAYAEHYDVPVVSGMAANVAAKINLTIQYSLLHQVPGHYHQPVFTEEDQTGGMTDLTFTVVRADSQVVTIDFEVSSMGAHPSVDHTWMSFDSHDGQLVVPEDILTAQGIERGKQAATKALLAGIASVIAHPDPARTAPGAEDDLKTQREAYERCTGELSDAQGDTRFEIGPVLTVARGCFFAHAILALDDVGEVTWQASYASLAPYMTPYGRCLLIERSAACRRASVAPTVGTWRGTIGKGSAIALIGCTSGASYFYERIGTSIGLDIAKAPPGHWILQHKNEQGVVLETFDLVPAKSGGFSGTWTQTGKPALPVVLQ